MTAVSPFIQGQDSSVPLLYQLHNDTRSGRKRAAPPTSQVRHRGAENFGKKQGNLYRAEMGLNYNIFYRGQSIEIIVPKDSYAPGRV